MRPVQLPKGAKIKDGRVEMPGLKPRDASQARSWAKGGRKNIQKVVTKQRARALNNA